ncbi:hypothetical protein KI387_011276, partial [Taxus chinensis]
GALARLVAKKTVAPLGAPTRHVTYSKPAPMAQPSVLLQLKFMRPQWRALFACYKSKSRASLKPLAHPLSMLHNVSMRQRAHPVSMQHKPSARKYKDYIGAGAPSVAVT